MAIDPALIMRFERRRRRQLVLATFVAVGGLSFLLQERSTFLTAGLPSPSAAAFAASATTPPAPAGSPAALAARALGNTGRGGPLGAGAAGPLPKIGRAHV